MNLIEMADLVAKVQMGDNRNVDPTVIDYWMSLIGDLGHGDALAALRRFRREQPGVYLEPGHLLQLAGVIDDHTPIPDVTPEVIAESRVRTLAAAGVTEEEYLAHEDDRVWVQARFGHLTERELEGYPE